MTTALLIGFGFMAGLAGGADIDFYAGGLAKTFLFRPAPLTPIARLRCRFSILRHPSRSISNTDVSPR